MVVHERDNGAGDEPSALHAGEEESVRLNEFAFGREFLNERSDCGPEHPEAGGDERVHQIKFPDFYPVLEGEDGDGGDDDGANGVEEHDQTAAIFAVDDDAGEGQNHYGGQGWYG